MQGVNLDLLHIVPHHADRLGRDLHSHHRSAHLAALRQTRQARRHAFLSRLALAVVRYRKPKSALTAVIFCPQISHGGPGV